MPTRSTPPVVLLPPSEGKAVGGQGPAWSAGTMRFDLDVARLQVMKHALGAQRTAVVEGPTMKAIDRYTGVLYGGLGYRALDRTARRRIDSQVVTFSGLFGLVAPADPIPFYKLKMTARAPRGGRLAAWWRSRLGPVLDAHVDGRVVWDLLPNEHTAAWPTSDAPAHRIGVRFLDDPGHGKLVTVSHWNKLLKGALVRHIIETQLSDTDGLAGFAHPEGYAYRPDLTVETPHRTVVSLVAPR
jgi:cytoplasmic iron level regulating protein YaaA (DUF328/UPF0246 family)